MKAVPPSAGAQVRFAPVAAALLALSWPASAEVTAVIRYRTGEKDTVIAQQTKPTGTGTATVRAARGTAASNGFADLTIPVGLVLKSATYRFGPTFKAKAEGLNPRDTTAPAGRSADRLNTWTEVRFGEVLTIPEAAAFDLDFKVHGTVTAEGENGAGFARAELQVAQGGVILKTLNGSSDAPGPFDGTERTITLANFNNFLTGLINYEARLYAITNTSIYKQNQAKADAGSTVTLTGLTVRNAAGKRIEAPDAASQSGFDYSPILNLPAPGAAAGPGEFSFASEALSAQEDGGTLLVRVNRDGGSDGAASVVVRNLTVPPVGEDFEPFSTTLEFAEGETQKFVFVKLLNDADLTNSGGSGSRTFEIELADATGATLSATSSTATVTVYDDDISWSAPDAGPQTLLARINPNGAAGETGLLTFSVNATGTATFSGMLRGKRFAGSGKEIDLDFIGDPKTVNVAGLGAVKFRLLRFGTIGGTPRLLGTATLPDNTELAIRGVAVYTTDKTKPKTSKRGAYTLLLEPPAGADAAAPKGTGYATVTVSDSGKTVITGKLADGTALTAGGTVNVLAELPLLLTLPAKRCELSGVLHFRYAPEVSDLDADLRWTRPSSTVKGPFMGGFATTLAAVGSRFSVPPTGAFILPALTSDNNAAVFEAEGPDLAASLVRQVSIGPAPQHKVTPEPNLEKLSIRVLGKTGLWNGSFRNGTKTVTFQGAVLKLGNRAGGYFLGPTQSGRVSLAPGTMFVP